MLSAAATRSCPLHPCNNSSCCNLTLKPTALSFYLLLLQFDSLVPVMTARESVEFAAAVRLPRGTTRDEAAARVDLVLQLMGLAEQQQMLVSKHFFNCFHCL